MKYLKNYLKKRELRTALKWINNFKAHNKDGKKVVTLERWLVANKLRGL
jgi:hypothetical protein